MKKNNNQPKKYPSNNKKTKEKTIPINLYKKNENSTIFNFFKIS